jgi:DNA modification methylase
MINLLLGDCIDKLKELEENSVDSIVTDPPYELGFMGKKWDSTGIANNKEMWAECLRVLKPGGHLLAFSGTRTYHRMASAIEDAGFEVRDMIEWIYGSGFPKSLNIGKAVDKLQGNEREIMPNPKAKQQTQAKDGIYGDYEATTTISKGTSEWEGWGTALKPSHETIAVAQKPFDSSSDIDYTVSICQTLFAQIVKKSSELNLNEKTQQGIAQWTAEKNINTLEDLSEVMDMLPSKSEASLSLNIVLSWLNILGEIWGAMSMFTTETKGSLTTELKILQSLEWENIFQNITQVKNNKTDGLSVDVLNVENLLNAVKLKLKYILTHSAQENAISQGNKLTFAPNHEPICMARKPLAEKTVAENVLKYGTGGINIDVSRVEAEPELAKNWDRSAKAGFGNGLLKGGLQTEGFKDNAPSGRFPANLILSDCEEVRECFPETKSVVRISEDKDEQQNTWSLGRTGTTPRGHNDSGNASRFFKSIKKDLQYSPKHAILKLCENNIGVNNAENNLKTTSQIELVANIFSALKNATPNLDLLNQNLNALFVEKSVDSIEIDFVAKCVAIKEIPEGLVSQQEYTVFQDFMEDYKKCSQTQNPVSVEKWGNTDITQIMISLLKLCGFVLPVINENTPSANREGQKCDYRSLVYIPKASKSERNKGCEKNGHPTVKPIALMEYLIKMVTPKGGVVLDPFMGSGSTGVAAKKNGYSFIGIDMTPEYVKIAKARILAE